MSDFIKIFEVVLPVMLIVLFGYSGKRLNLFSDLFINTGSKLVFKVFLPINMFMNIYTASSLDSADPMIVAYVFSGQLITLFVLNIIYSKMGFDNEEKAIMLQTMIRSNIVLFGLSIAMNYFPQEQVSIVAIYIGIIAALTNGLAIIIYEVFTRKEKELDIKKIVLSIFKNPIFVAAVLGIIVNGLDIKIYEPLLKAADDLGSIATPLGLLCVGGTITFGKKDKDTLATVTSVLTKSIFLPLIALTIFTLLGVTGPEMFVMIIVFASPVAVSSHAMALMYTNRGKLCAEIIVYTTIFNSFTTFFAIFILSKLGVI